MSDEDGMKSDKFILFISNLGKNFKGRSEGYSENFRVSFNEEY